MKRVTAFVGSARKKHTYNAVHQFLDNLQSLGDVDYEIVAQGIYGGEKIVKYLDFVGNGLGFNTVKGTCFTALEPMTEKEKQKIDRVLARQSLRFYEKLVKQDYPAPTLFKLMAFRMGRTSIKLELDDSSRDYRYYKDKGWFESDYFYPVRLGPLKKLAGGLFDSIQTRMTRNRKSQSALSSVQ